MTNKTGRKRMPWTMLLKNYPHSQKLNSVSEGAETLYLRMVALSDDYGNFYGEPEFVAIYAMGHRLAKGQITEEAVADRLRELDSVGLTKRYDNGKHLHLQGCYKYLRDDVERDDRFPHEPANFIPVVNVRKLNDGTGAARARHGGGTLREGKRSKVKASEEELAFMDSLVNQFADAFREATGEEYDRNWGDDRKWAKELLAKHGPATADLLKTRLANAIAAHKNNTADYWRFPSCARQLSGAGWNKYATPPPSNGQRPRLVDPTRRAMTPAEVEASLRD